MALGARVLVATVPVPVRVHEWYLEVREVPSRDVVTVIEVLSPTNKLPGKGRHEYEEKRQEVLGTRTNLVEIDLLRIGERMPAYIHDWPPDAPPPGDYCVLVARSRRRARAVLYAFTVRDPLPEIPIPLLPQDQDVSVDLQALFHTLYDNVGYDLMLDYRRPPVPPLRAEDEAWADALLREHGLR